ncbi:PilZ domain-containing protein [Modicisalibacter radicis]|uniref:PilZ domain-containing protein n=1 Tax=Halomonas sp. EAR18 TaxID=2518972 RepID=UPI00109D6A54|nr:PilZ domain-containing protein [Halomonas sp. EAR18]
MSDDHSRDPNRKEPTLDGPGHERDRPARTDHEQASQPSESHDEHVARDGQLSHERRDERRHVRVAIPFQVRFEDDTTLSGHDLSLGGFSVYSDKPIEEGKVVSASLLLMAGAAELIVPVDAKVLRDEGRRRDKQYEIAFEITKIARRHRELLRRVIRAHLSGNHASVESLVATEDPQTPRKRKSSSAAHHQPRQRKPWGRYLALTLAALTLLAVLTATAYRNFMLIEPDFAAVTAPRIDILSPGAGQLSDHSLQPGDRVERDQQLARVNNSDLQTDLIQARAAHDYNSRLIENMRERLENSDAQQISMAQSTTPSNGRPPSYETVSPEVAEIRIKQFIQARDYEQSRVDALEARASANALYSPCDCVVAWALGSGGGTFINKGDRLMTLIRTGENDIMVEALVHMDQISDIEPHQVAYVALPNASEPIEARVRSVALDVERQPRAGFPEWVRQEQNVASVLLVPEDPLDASDVGKPVDVRFSEAPIIDGMAEWIWQGGRAVAQTVGDWFDSALAKASSLTG